MCFLNGVFFGLWRLQNAKKPYSLDSKILCLDLKIVSFASFRPPQDKNDILALNTKKVFTKSGFLCFLIGGHFWPLEARKCEKPYCVDQKSFINLIKTLNFATFEPLDLQKWPAPQIKGLVTAISKMPEKICFDTSKST